MTSGVKIRQDNAILLSLNITFTAITNSNHPSASTHKKRQISPVESILN